MACRTTRLCLALTFAAAFGGSGALEAQEIPAPPAPEMAPEIFPAASEGAPPNAFTSSCRTEDCRPFFFHIGPTALQRQRLHPGAVGFIDPGGSVTTVRNALIPVTGQDAVNEPGETVSRTVLVPGVVTTTTTGFVHSGNRAPAGAPSFGDYNNNLEPKLGWGLEATLGWNLGDHALELTGYYVVRNESTARFFSASLPPGSPAVTQLASINQVNALSVFDTDRDNDGVITAVGPVPAAAVQPASTNRFDLPFFNEPAGFRGLWLQADKVQFSLQSSLGDAEVNDRYAFTGTDLRLLAGVRYLDEQERFSLLTQDDAFGTPSATTAYQTQTHNRILAAQLGVEWRKDLLQVAAVSATAKGAWGVNFIDSDVSLERGDGLFGFNTHRNQQGFAQVYELALMGDLYLNQTVGVRAGYRALWVVGVAEAVQQVDYDLSHTNGSQRNDGNVFYHGPTVELTFSF